MCFCSQEFGAKKIKLACFDFKDPDVNLIKKKVEMGKKIDWDS
jgi:hypothetical protein